jgi:hypothetical protein
MNSDGRQKIVIEQCEEGSWQVAIYRWEGRRWKLKDTATYDTCAEALNWNPVHQVGVTDAGPRQPRSHYVPLPGDDRLD